MIPIGSVIGGVNALAGLLNLPAGPHQREAPVESSARSPVKAPVPHPEVPAGARAALQRVLARVR